LNKDDVQPEFPLAINRCRECYHVQLTHAVNPDLMFKDYLYVSGTSKTMDNHFKWFSKYSLEYYTNMNDKMQPRNVLDIGCNDGSQLNHYKELGVSTFGVDPAENLYEISSKNHNMYCGYFDQKYVDDHQGQSFDIIVAQNVFAHNYDPLTFLRNIKQMMNGNSLLFIQTSQADMIKNNEFDTIYHEHISFYNINSMNELCKRVGVNLIDATKCPLHGNSYIFVISIGTNRSANIDNLIKMEANAGLMSEHTYREYAIKCNNVSKDFYKAIVDAQDRGFKVIGYGAAAKGMTLLNYSKAPLDLIVDDNPLKQNRWTPGSSIRIIAFDDLPHNPDIEVMFVPLAWNFFEEITTKIKSKRNNPNDRFMRYFPRVSIS
jgi:cyclopropane fatty-acyl-phospholipid synthase-like methyltransferase